MIEKLIDSYLKAKNEVCLAGYIEEIEWQKKVSVSSLNETSFLQEATWVILNSGMRESVIRSHFPKISKAFEYWVSADYILKNQNNIQVKTLSIFNHKGKIEAVFSIAKKIKEIGFLNFKNELLASPIEFLSKLPYMGPATSRHLAKNLGIDYSKPDRHLNRIAKVAGFKDTEELCLTINEYTSDSISEIDIVLWRFATINSKYQSIFAI